MKKIYILLSFCLVHFIAQAQTIPAYVPTNGLVGWWPFNGNANDDNDESGNGNNGTVNGATLTSDRFGNVGKAYSFDGVNDYIQTSNISFANGGDFSISIWINLSEAYANGSPQHYVFANNVTAGGPYLNTDINQSQFGCIEVYTNISINNWHHLVGVKSGTNYNLYIDNVVVGLNTNCNTNFINGYPIYFGNSSVNTEFTHGTLDDIAIYNRALTQQEITALYQAPPPCTLSITSQPTNQSSTTGSNASFNVGVTATYCNNPTTYQWQTNTGFGWQTLQLAGQYTGVNTSTLHVSNVGSTNTNQLFRCLIQNGTLADTTQTATLSVVNTGNTTLSAVTHAIPYQAVVRDGAGNPLINHPLSVRCTLHDNTASGTSIYQETHTITTNNLGLFTLHIGTGVASIGNIDSIHWALYKKYLQVEFDTTAQGVSYIDLGTQQLMAVPYALYAETAGNALNAPKGDNGVDGVNGSNGVNGVDGTNGQNGVNGADGISVTSANITNDSLYLSLSNSQTLNAGKLNAGLPNGTTAGEMMYWNGTAWVSVAPTTSLPGNQSKTLRFCNGMPTWEDCPAVLPTVTGTTAISNISYSTANSGGTITNDGGAAVTARGVCWSTSSNPTIALSTKTIDGSGIGSFTSSIMGLQAATNYYVRAYATNSVGTAYGNQVVFTTTALTSPTLTTTAISAIRNISANSGGSISLDGGAAVTARGVCWNTSSNPTAALSTKTIDGIGSGSFTSSITGLLAATTYYVRAYATNIMGTSYGNQVVFTTNATLAIGSSFQGGIIAYILQAGDPGYDANVPHGLIAAPSDQSTGIQWYNGSYVTTGATATALGTGNANTNTIVSVQGAGSYAAKLCYDLVLNGYSDWYLPSKDELDKLYLNRTAIGGFAAAYYWSSSEGNTTNAWNQYFSLGGQASHNKSLTNYVRAVRAF